MDLEVGKMIDSPMGRGIFDELSYELVRRGFDSDFNVFGVSGSFVVPTKIVVGMVVERIRPLFGMPETNAQVVAREGGLCQLRGKSGWWPIEAFRPVFPESTKPRWRITSSGEVWEEEMPITKFIRGREDGLVLTRRNVSFELSEDLSESDLTIKELVKAIKGANERVEAVDMTGLRNLTLYFVAKGAE